MSEVHCQKCGNTVQPTDRFCRKCGSPLFVEIANPKAAKSTSINQSNQSKGIKQIFGFVILALCITNIVLSVISLVIYGGMPYSPGDVAKVNPNTASPIFWGEFYSTGNGTIEFLDNVPTELSNANWIVVARDLPFGRKEEIIQSNKAVNEQPGIMNVNVYIPKVAVSERTFLKFRVAIKGYIARPIDNNNFVYDLSEMKSEPITIQIVPSEMRWLIRQLKWLPFSFIAGWFTFFMLKPKK